MGKYAGMVGEQLERFSRFGVSESESSEGLPVFSTYIDNEEGTMKRRLDVKVNEEQKTINMRVCLSSGVSGKCSMDRLNRWINEMEGTYLYARLYVDSSGDLISDYRSVVEIYGGSSGGQDLGKKNILEMLRVVAGVMMEYVSGFETFMEDRKNNSAETVKKRLGDSAMQLDPFLNRR